MRVYVGVIALLISSVIIAGQPDMKSMVGAKGQCREGKTYCDCVTQQCNECVPADDSAPAPACQKVCQEADSCTDSSAD